MRASIPEISAVSWTSFATGTNPGVHGIFGFVDLKPGSYALRFPSFRDCRARTIWERVGDAGGRSIVINQPSTYPARPMQGCLISGFVAIDLEKAIHPPELLPRLKQAGYRIDIDTVACRTDHELLWRELEETLECRRSAVDLLWGEEWNYFEVVVTGTDRLQHYLWEHITNPEMEHHQASLDYYRRIDSFVGEVWDRFRALEGEDAIERFFVLSDHGFSSVEREVYLNRWLQEEGYLEFESGSPESLEEIDSGSRAFCLDPGRIFINRERRFPRGSVREADAGPLAEEIGDKLAALRCEGKLVVRKVFARDEVYQGPRALDGADLTVLGNEGFDLKGRIDSDVVFGRSDLTGMHTWDDAFVLTGADLEKPIIIWDIAAAIEKSLGMARG
jgi:predicted AlkP superfamily phosphohydrolase/phosphomutase